MGNGEEFKKRARMTAYMFNTSPRGILCLPRIFFTSLTRISDLESRPFQVVSKEREQWATGDYVVGKVITPLGKLSRVELASGQMVEKFLRR